MDRHPEPASDLVVEHVGGDVVVYDATTDQIHLLSGAPDAVQVALDELSLGRRSLLRGTAVGGALIVASLLTPRLAVAASGSLVDGGGGGDVTGAPPVTSPTTFTFTAGPQAFAVPAGVSTLTVTLRGGSGGTIDDRFYTGYPGGLGAQVTTVLPVVPGEVLEVVVAGQGQRGYSFDDNNATDTNFGGYGGGGAGGDERAVASFFGSGGGGATTLSRATTLLAIASGGGGNGRAYTSSPDFDGSGSFKGTPGPGGNGCQSPASGVAAGVPARGAAGGDSNLLNNERGPSGATGGGGGQGGSSAGGAGGTAGHGDAENPNYGYVGEDGRFRQGGHGAPGSHNATDLPLGAAGGGGGGWFGGGGGGVGGYAEDGNGGGGGGSSWSSASYDVGHAPRGDGSLTISWG